MKLHTRVMVTSHQKPKVAYHVVGKRNKSSSHLVKLNKLQSAKNPCQTSRHANDMAREVFRKGAECLGK